MSNPSIDLMEKVTGVKARYDQDMSTTGTAVYKVTSVLTDVHLFDVLVAESDLTISILYPDSQVFVTEGRAIRRTFLEEDGVTSRISSDSVKAYIYLRAAKFLIPYYVK